MTALRNYVPPTLSALSLILCAQAAISKAPQIDTHFEEVLVTAVKREQILLFSPQSSSVVNAQTLRESTAANIADILIDVPGLQISDSGQAGMRRVRIRGEDSNRVAILIDGQEVTDHRGTGVPLSIDPSMVERVEVIRGGGGVLYGSKALGGVVNFITKKGGEAMLQGRIGSSFDSASSGKQMYSSIFGSSSTIDYRLSVNRDEQGDRETPDGKIDNTSSQSRSVYANLGYRANRQNFSLSFDDHNANSEVFVEDSVRFSPPFIDFALSIPQRDRQKLAFFYHSDFDGEVLNSLKADAFLQRSDRVFKTFPSLQFGPTTLNSETNTVSQLDTRALNLQAVFHFGSQNIAVAGAQFLEDDMEQTRLGFDSVNGAPTIQTERIDDKASTSTAAIFIHNEWRATSLLSINTGLRSYWVDSELKATTRDGLPSNRTSDEEVIASASAAYSFSANSLARFSYSEGYVYPSLLQLQTGAIAGASFANPNASLVPENSQNREFGYRFYDRYSEYDLSIFSSRAENYIDFVACEDIDACIGGRAPVIYKNIGESETLGAELHTSFRFLEGRLKTSANITWLKRKNVTAALSSYDTGIPRWTGNLNFRYSLSNTMNYKMWLKSTIRFESDALDRFSNREENSSGGWLSTALSAGLSFGEKKQHLLVLELSNIADKRYRFASDNIDAAGRSLGLKLELRSL